MADPTLPYEHPPVFPLGVVAAWLLLVGAAAAAVLTADEPMPTSRLLVVVGVVAVLAGVVAAVAVPGSMKRLTVDDAGLHVRGELALRARDIGDVDRVGGGVAAATSWPGSRRRGTPLPSRQNLYGGLFGFGPAVAVVDERDPRSPTLWLLPSRRADELATALRLARDTSR